ncbi:MAG: carboxypeptidase-like regulatory domain-containing protein, partial [Bacteroidaceae bacterium]|nr:carboxypeptidase-like regulatory domain-containing protein [Bacteroidaceae bacterium]
MMKKLIDRVFFFCIIFLMTDCSYVVAQKVAVGDTLGVVTGRFTDKDKSGMPGILLRVVTAKDSVFCAGAVTDSLGCYSIRKLPVGRYVMSYSLVGYQTGIFKFSVTAAHPIISVSDIQIKPADVILRAAVVTASMPPVTVMNDTVAYNADAYHAPEGAMLEDLISLIPGAETADNGQLKINGKIYDKILINGRKFFGNDPQMALKNLPANIIKKIKTYDRKSDLARLTGIDDGVENDVLDIEIKPNMFKGLVGQASAATGNHDRYSSSLNINKFRSEYHLSAMGGMNNVNNPGFSERGKGAVNFSQAKRPGLTASKGGGISYAKDKKDKYRFSGNARYNFSNAENQTSRHAETDYNDSTFRYNDNTSHSVRWHDEFNMNFNLEWTPDTLTSIQLRPNFSYSKTNNWSMHTSESEKWDGNLKDDSVKINQRRARNTSGQEGSDEDVT